MTQRIDADDVGNLGLGQEGVTASVIFRMYDNTVAFLGLKSGYGEPSDPEIFPSYTFGFYQQLPLHGFFDPVLYLVFNDGTSIKTLQFNSDGKGELEPPPMEP